MSNMRMKLPRVDCSRGAPMGRRQSIPVDRDKLYKFRLQRLRFVDQCYDEGGAYWGGGDYIWWAECEISSEPKLLTYESARLFVRAEDRAEAKEKVREILPRATFYR